MGTLKKRTSNPSSDRLAWRKIFKALVDITQSQQRQLESLAKERKFFENRIKLQYDRWVSDVKLFEDQISQMKSDFQVQEMVRLVEVAKSDLILSLKHKEAFMYKLRLEDLDDERTDLKLLFNDLSSCLASPKRITRSDRSNNSEENRCKTLECDVKRLKLENRKLKSSNNSDVSALLSERDFVWNQYKKMENDLNEEIKRARAEVENANEKTQNLLTSLEQFQSWNIEKDNLIVTLKDDMAKLESDSIKKSEEISRLSRELELLRKSRSDSVTPIFHRCTAESGQYGLGGKNSMVNVNTKKDLDHSQMIVKGRSSKRKAVEGASTFETPRLFSSRFKVPKLKNSSPLVV